ncbi:uncharacterized protein Dwil_GK22410 [Drosophila willistoni]|uniref:MARVEL domain-containing protein n=1 Tax=Drosophila willistoni TaxID=7260 RepID=B4NG60_DROWI|nr:uncharacterized protein LOC6649628 [Drosophila willistoni]XP_046865383.1 uncharacterized protein LOC6649628 [Drosophila willistoni]XP_046865384.1 uncharacterized protein LOC6649628 [Drosophila willistoni]EDW83277.1 uncharacterized protein Dwil_GK22410 [Drosophila willistoni]
MISRKEVVAIMLLLTALICILNAAVFGNILPTYISYEQLTLQCVNIGTAYICLLYALSTWMYHSNISRVRLQMRLVLIIMVLIMFMANMVAFVFYMRALSKFFMESTDTSEIFTAFDVKCRTITLVLSIITVILLFIVAITISLTVLKQQQRASTKIEAPKDRS